LISLLAVLGQNQSQTAQRGWYHVTYTNGHEVTMHIEVATRTGFIARYEGTTVEIADNQVHEIKSIADHHRDEPGSLSVEDEIAVRDAIEQLGTMDTQAAIRAFAEVSKRFPDCRSVVHENLSHRVKRVRKLLVKLLGENGDAANDLEVVKPLLADGSRSRTTARQE
jgi:translation elongation factor EF-Ts